MKKRSISSKILTLANALFAVLLLLSYGLAYMPPSAFASLSLLSLAVPVLILCNILFLLYWAIRLRREVIVSLLVLLLGVSHINSMYRYYSKSENSPKSEPDIVSFLSFNVHQFNRFDWIKSNKKVPVDITNFVKNQEATFFCSQEFYHDPDIDFSFYPESFIDFNNNDNEVGQTIFSKLPIIKKGNLNFKNTCNNAIYVDAIWKKDTIRVYNVHLQSHKIIATPKFIKQNESKKLLKRVANSFKEQQVQVAQLLEHLKGSPYPVVVLGDLNNTAFSYIYNQLIEFGLVDAFKEAGSGFGKTFDFKLFPIRIDFVLVDPRFTIHRFENFYPQLSDHYPIKASISL